MSFALEFRKEAQNDILGILKWYEVQRHGLGDEFLIALENELKIIQKNPYYYQEKYKSTRKAIIKRFPYHIFFEIETERKVLIYAVLHMKRDPSYWKKRL